MKRNKGIVRKVDWKAGQILRKPVNERMGSNMRKKAIVAVVLAAVMLGTTACGGSGKGVGKNPVTADVSGEVHYVLDENKLDIPEGSYPRDIMVRDGSVFFTASEYPEYPDEYNEKLDELQKKYFGEEASGNIEEADKDDYTVIAGSKSDTDDDLLGDIDDIFDDKKDDAKDDKDDASDDKKDDVKDDKDDASDNKKDDVKDDKDDASDDSTGDVTDGDSASDSDDEEASKKFEAEVEELNKQYQQYQTVVHVYKYSVDKGNTEEITSITGDYANYYACTVDNAGEFKGLYTDYSDGEMSEEAEDEGVKASIMTFNMDGTVKDTKNVDFGGDKLSDEASIASAQFDFNGNYYISTSTDDGKSVIYKYDSDGKFVNKITNDSYVDSFIFDNEGNAIAGIYKEDGLKYYYLDFEKGDMGSELEGVCDKGQYLTAYSGYGSYSFLVADSTCLYSYDEKAKTKNVVLKWIDSGIVSNNIYSIAPIDDKSFVCIYNEGEDSNSVGILKQSTGEQQEKKVIKVASVYADSDLQKIIVDYNKQSDKYKIEFTNYGDADNPSTAMMNDIIAGNIADVINLSNIDIANLVAKGILDDLTPYYEKDDTVNKDYFIDGVLNAVNFDGKQYVAVKSFSIDSVAGKKSELASFENGWTLNDLMTYYNSKKKGTKLFEYDSQTSALYNLIMYNIDDYIDWNTGKCSFDSEEFKKAVEFCKTFPSDDDLEAPSDESFNPIKDIKNGKQLLSLINASCMSDFQMALKLFNDDYMEVGYPSSSGKGTYFNIQNGYGISSTSDNKDEAWNFIKEVLKAKDANNFAFPASKEAFEKQMKKETTTTEYTDEDGNKVEPKDETNGYEEIEVKIGPATEEEVALFCDMVTHSRLENINSDMIEMLVEDISSYFKGDEKDINNVVKVLQDKMTKYVNENK